MLEALKGNLATSVQRDVIKTRLETGITLAMIKNQAGSARAVKLAKPLVRISVKQASTIGKPVRAFAHARNT